MDVTMTATEVLEHLARALSDATLEERLMVLLYVGEHCKAQVETILAHEYHMAIYKGGE